MSEEIAKYDTASLAISMKYDGEESVEGLRERLHKKEILLYGVHYNLKIAAARAKDLLKMSLNYQARNSERIADSLSENDGSLDMRDACYDASGLATLVSKICEINETLDLVLAEFEIEEKGV